MACAGDIPTLETLAAVDILRRELPDLRVRVVNVVDLMRLQPDSEHPHGLSDHEFDALFTADRPVIFAYHGYPWLIHRLTYRRTNHRNLHVRGYKEEGTTTTPFDMVDAQRPRPLPPRHGRDRPRAGPRRARRRAAPARWSTSGCAARVHARARRRPAGVRDWTWPHAEAVRVLVVNAGSSSLKLRLLDGDDARARARRCRAAGVASTPTRCARAIGDGSAIDAVGHRIVHGGERFIAPVRDRRRRRRGGWRR